MDVPAYGSDSDSQAYARAEAPAEVLEFSDDLRGPDVRALRAFLDVRLDELADTLPQDTDAGWAADRLAVIVDAECRDLDDALGTWLDVLVQGRKDEPGLFRPSARTSIPRGTV